MLEGFNDLRSTAPHLAEEWADENGLIQPEDVTAHSNRKVWWKCGKCGYLWRAHVSDRTDGSGCPVCAGEITAAGINDLASLHPELGREWSDRNSGSPADCSPKSREAVWWHCHKCGHEWRAAIHKRVSGKGCPVCEGKSVKAGINDLKTIHPSLASEWDYEKNRGLRPEEVLATSMKPVFWKGCCRHSWRAKVSDRIRNPVCPICERNRPKDLRRKAFPFYAEQAGVEVRYEDETEVGISLQFFLPEYRTALHIYRKKEESLEGRKREIARNWLCLRSGIRLIRIVPPDAEIFDTCFHIIREDDSILSWNQSFQVVFDVLKVKADVNLGRDRTEIWAWNPPEDK